MKYLLVALIFLSLLITGLPIQADGPAANVYPQNINDQIITTYLGNDLWQARIPITSSTNDACIFSGVTSTYSAARNATSGAVLNGTTMTVGQLYDSDAESYAIFRGFLFFDTSSLTSNAVIGSTQLWMYETNLTDNLFYLDLQSGNTTYPHVPVVGGDFDYNHYSSRTQLGLIISGDQWTTYDLNSTAKSFINTSGTTKFVLRNHEDYFGTAPTDYRTVQIRTGKYYGHDFDFRPYLTIVYYLPPAITAKAATNIGVQSAKLNTTVSNLGLDTSASVRFGYGLVSQNATDFNLYSNLTAWQSGFVLNDNPSAIVTFSYNASATYYYRAQIQTAWGTVTSSSEISFTSLNAKAVLSDYNLTPVPPGLANPAMPAQMFSELNPSILPGAAGVNQLLAHSGTPQAVWWYPFLFGIIGVLAFIVYNQTTRNGAEGSLFSIFIVSEMGLAFLGIIGGGTTSVIPFFPSILNIIPCLSIILWRRRPYE